MGTHPIFESDFDCLTDKMAAHKGLRNKLIWRKSKSRTARCPTGSGSKLIIKSNTTQKDVTGAEPKLDCKPVFTGRFRFGFKIKHLKYFGCQKFLKIYFSEILLKGFLNYNAK